MCNWLSECIFHYASFVGNSEVYEAKWTYLSALFSFLKIEKVQNDAQKTKSRWYAILEEPAI